MTVSDHEGHFTYFNTFKCCCCCYYCYYYYYYYYYHYSQYTRQLLLHNGCKITEPLGMQASIFGACPQQDNSGELRQEGHLV